MAYPGRDYQYDANPNYDVNQNRRQQQPYVSQPIPTEDVNRYRQQDGLPPQERTGRRKQKSLPKAE